MDEQTTPTVTVTGTGEVVVLFEDDFNGNHLDIRAVHGAGAVWPPTWSGLVTVLSQTDGESSGTPSTGGNKDKFVQTGPRAVVDPASGSVVAVWLDSRITKNADVFSSTSTDGGATWSTNVRVTQPQGNSPNALPRLTTRSVAAGGGVIVVLRRAAATVGDIRALVSHDAGAAWGGSLTVSDSTTGQRDDPGAAVDADGRLNVIWTDAREADLDVYFSSGLIDLP